MAKRGRPTGHKMSEESKQKISMSMVGKKHTKKTKQNIRYSLLAYFDEYGTISNEPVWTDAEIKQLKKLRAKCMPVEIISNIMKRSFRAILTKAQEFKIKSNYLPRWTDEEIITLISSKEKGLSEKQISILIGRTISSIKNKWCRIQSAPVQE